MEALAIAIADMLRLIGSTGGGGRGVRVEHSGQEGAVVH